MTGGPTPLRLALALLGLFPAAALAAESRTADPPPGASACSGCHAPAASGGGMAPLEGRPAGDIVASMRGFRSGALEATVMDRIAKGFTDEETRAIADWYAARGGRDAAAKP